MNNVSDPNSLIKGSPYYYSAGDNIRLDYYGTRIKETTWSFVETGTGRTHSKTFTAPSNKWYIASGFTCVGTYSYTAKDGAGNVLLSYNLTVEKGDLQNPICESNDEDGLGDENNPGTPEGEGGNGTPVETKCWTEVCKCIADLEQPINNVSNTVNQQISITNSKLDTVNSNITTTNSKLDVVNSNITNTNNHLSDLKEISTDIKDEVISLHDEFKTDKDYTLKKNPDISKVLDENRPKENTVPFEDKTIYFKDEGDAPDSDIGPLPKGPDVKHWDGFLPENEMPSEDELKKDSEGKKEEELKKNEELKQEGEKKKDEEMKKEDLQQSPILEKESFETSPEMEKDSFKQADEMKKTHQYQQTNKFP